jgi:hypothetical protein
VPISVTCSKCGHTLSVKDKYAGKKGLCPKCQSAIQIPGPDDELQMAPLAKQQEAVAASVPAAAATAPPLSPRGRGVGGEGEAAAVKPAPSRPALAKPKAKPVALPRDEVRDRLAAAFATKFEPPKVSLLRKLAMLFVASIVVTLPLFYIVAVGLLMVGLYIAATSSVIPDGLPLYATLGAGAIVLLCLLKPLVVPRRRSVRSYTIDKSEEPLVHEVVDRVCENLNAPRPKSVRLECSTHYGAAYRRGLLGYLTGDLALTIGLPLTACMSVGQLASLVAGEIAPYRRRCGSGLMTLIGSINGWLWRSVYEPDRFDEWVNRAISRPGMHLVKLLWPLKAVRIVPQIVLFIPMFIGNTVAAGLVKRTQFDSDRCQARLAGKDDFEPTQQRAAVAGFNWEGVLAELNYLRKEGQLPDNLPRQLQLRMIDVTPELTGVLMETVVKRVEKPFDARPSDADRLAAIAAEPAAGAVTSDLPAWHLFSNFDKLAGEITWEYYSAAYGKQLVHAALKPVELPAGA